MSNFAPLTEENQISQTAEHRQNNFQLYLIFNATPGLGGPICFPFPVGIAVKTAICLRYNVC